MFSAPISMSSQSIPTKTTFASAFGSPLLKGASDNNMKAFQGVTEELLPSTAGFGTTGNVPIVAINMWEHAYLIDYGISKNAYVANFWNAVNWNRAAVILNLY
jgi:superoxide dismutase